MPQIKFSHLYCKLKDSEGRPITKAKLLEVTSYDLKDMSRSMFDYDTDKGQYDLPKTGLYMILLFQKPSRPGYGLDLFTTIRRYTLDKNKYYRELIGKTFDIVYKEPNGK